MEPLKLPAQMQAPRWRSDDSVSLAFVTSQEISDALFGEISQFKKVNGWLLFAPNRIAIDQVPPDPTVPKGNKSRSQRIRMKLFKLHMQRGGSEATADAYYNEKMDQYEQLIDDLLD